MPIAKVIKDADAVPVKTWTDDIEDEALTQLKNLARLPFLYKGGVAAMADCHAGKGSTVGTVIATEKAVIPSAVGADLGCGVAALRLGLKASDLPDGLQAVRSRIEEKVPVGFGQHDSRSMPDISCLRNPPTCIADSLFGGDYEKTRQKFHPQLGTLGGGNHFIEVCVDEAQAVWVLLHSGSRGIGSLIGAHFVTRAKRRMEQHYIHLPDTDLAFLPEGTDDFREYMDAVEWAQYYAKENRRVMLQRVLDALRETIPVEFGVTDEAISCHHNYVSRENHFGRNLWITRKGAIRAGEGDLGVIPGSMGQRSYVVRGKGNLESYRSCSHGAGRRMSRTQARATFTMEDLQQQTAGVECRKDAAVLDEIPGSYKNIDTVMANQTDLVEVAHVLKAVLCVKG